MSWLISRLSRSGTVESKIRLLVKQLEYVDTLQLAHPFVDGFDRVNYCLTTEESHIVMTGEVPPEIAARAKEDYETKENILKVYTTSFFIGLMVEPKDRECFLVHTVKCLPGTLILIPLCRIPYQPIRRLRGSWTLLGRPLSLPSSSKRGTGLSRTRWASSYDT